MFISLEDIQKEPDRWKNTSYLCSDGKTEYREKPKYGNRHVVFKTNAVLGSVHEDEFNAIDFPIGTVKHAANYVEEETSIPKEAVIVGAAVVGGYVSYKIGKWLWNKLNG